MPRPLRVLITFLVGSALFVGVPLVAWGVGDARGFLAEPARAGYVALVLALNLLAAWRIPEIGGSPRQPAATVRRQHSAVVLLQVLSIALVVVGPYCDRRAIAVLGGAPIVRYLGFLLYATGFLVMHLAEARLGPQFSVEVAIQPGHTLVTDGLYRHLRHPRYLGIVVFSAGLALVFRSWISLAAVAAVLLVLLWRMHDEEALMRREFGAAWEAYCRRTWRMVPYLY